MTWNLKRSDTRKILFSIVCLKLLAVFLPLYNDTAQSSMPTDPWHSLLAHRRDIS